jgi:hypothetical protein
MAYRTHLALLVCIVTWAILAGVVSHRSFFILPRGERLALQARYPAGIIAMYAMVAAARRGSKIAQLVVWLSYLVTVFAVLWAL